MTIQNRNIFLINLILGMYLIIIMTEGLVANGGIYR